jgi:hypothetical protein
MWRDAGSVAAPHDDAAIRPDHNECDRVGPIPGGDDAVGVPL